MNPIPQRCVFATTNQKKCINNNFESMSCVRDKYTTENAINNFML